MNKPFSLFLAACLAVYPVAAQDTVRGRASYYSDQLHGRRMSNGQRYNRDSLTCAHLKFPLGTMLRVKNLRNGKEVVVKVTDRGPHSKRFTIDLSKAAARQLDMLRAGHVQVEITPYKAVLKSFRMKNGEDIPQLKLSNHTWPGEPADTVAKPAGNRQTPQKADTLQSDTTRK
ncbi:MAG: septal ring lytic transglycosylase RlpA family protein [Clostridium sp.]|nr:septal ring lytic transglycosylase RlpA family protein [Clostridium sp.]